MNNPSARKRISEFMLKRKPISEETRTKIREKAKERVRLGLHKGWKSRKNPSYAELFFMKVLKNNQIEYEFEKKVGKYFIDFAINDKK